MKTQNLNLRVKINVKRGKQKNKFPWKNVVFELEHIEENFLLLHLLSIKKQVQTFKNIQFLYLIYELFLPKLYRQQISWKKRKSIKSYEEVEIFYNLLFYGLQQRCVTIMRN